MAMDKRARTLVFMASLTVLTGLVPFLILTIPSTAVLLQFHHLSSDVRELNLRIQLDTKQPMLPFWSSWEPPVQEEDQEPLLGANASLLHATSSGLLLLSECNPASGHCQCLNATGQQAQAGSTSDHDQIPACAAVSERFFQEDGAVVTLDKDSWLVRQVPMGFYQCQTTTCFVNDVVTPDTDAFLTTLHHGHQLKVPYFRGASFGTALFGGSEVAKLQGRERIRVRWVMAERDPQWGGKQTFLPVSMMNIDPHVFPDINHNQTLEPQAPSAVPVLPLLPHGPVPSEGPKPYADFIERADIGWFAECSSPLHQEMVREATTMSLLLPVEWFGDCMQDKRAAVVASGGGPSDLHRRFPACFDSAHVHNAAKGGHRSLLEDKYCMFSHFKFVLITEGHRTPGLVTQQLWTALAVGVVPVYMGAPDVKNVLPDPDAAIVVDDFSTLSALADYLSHACKDRPTYMKHLQWRSKPRAQWNPQFVSALYNQQGNMVCRLCDATRRQQQHNHQRDPEANGLLPSETLLTNLRRRVPKLSVTQVNKCARFFSPQTSSISLSPQPKSSQVAGKRWHTAVDAVYVVHWGRGVRRKSKMVRRLLSLGLQAYFYEAFDGEDITTDELACAYTEWDGLPLQGDHNRGAGGFAPFGKQKPLSPAEVSCAFKHWGVFHDIVQNRYAAALVFEDDLSVDQNLHNTLMGVMAEAPLDFDFIWGVHVPPKSTRQQRKSLCAWSNTRLGRNLCKCADFLGTAGYIVSLQGAQKALQRGMPFDRPIDMTLKHLWETQVDWKVLCADPQFGLHDPGDSLIDSLDSLHGRRPRG